MKPSLQLYCVENIIKVLAEESDILFAFLFGSYAKGTHDDKSDIVLRDDGVSYGDYVEQLTYLLFLKMADEQTKASLQQALHDPGRT